MLILTNTTGWLAWRSVLLTVKCSELENLTKENCYLKNGKMRKLLQRA